MLFRKIDKDSFRRLCVLEYTTQLSHIFQYSHCTFVTTLLRLFIIRLFLNITVRKRAFVVEYTTRFGLIELTFGEGKYLSRTFCTAVGWTSQTDSCLQGSFSSVNFYLVLVAQSVERFLVSVLHAHNRRAGNCIGLLSNTALLLSTDGKLLVLFEHYLIPCDLHCRSLNSRSWR